MDNANIRVSCNTGQAASTNTGQAASRLSAAFTFSFIVQGYLAKQTSLSGKEPDTIMDTKA